MVQDAGAQGLEDATVTLATHRYPFPTAGSTTLATHHTGEGGVLKLRTRRQWVWQIPLPDGIRWYDWSYCVEKPGYLAVVAVEPKFGEPHTVVLQRSQTLSVCRWPSADEP